MRRRHLVLATPLTLLFGSCATEPSEQERKYARLRDYAGEDFGYAVLSVGIPKSAPYSSAALGFSELATGSLGAFTYAPKLLFSSTPRDFDSSASEGTVLVKRLPPGEYEIATAAGLWHGGPYAVSKFMRLDKPIGFAIVSGRVCYLGRYLIGSEGNAFSGIASLEVVDEQDRDVATAATRTSGLARADIRSFVRVGTYGKR